MFDDTDLECTKKMRLEETKSCVISINKCSHLHREVHRINEFCSIAMTIYYLKYLFCSYEWKIGLKRVLDKTNPTVLPSICKHVIPRYTLIDSMKEKKS